jgi:hypothetical protein
LRGPRPTKGCKADVDDDDDDDDDYYDNYDDDDDKESVYMTSVTALS